MLGNSTSTVDATVVINVDAILDLPHTGSATTSPVNAISKVIVRQNPTSTTSRAYGNLYIFKGNDSQTELDVGMDCHHERRVGQHQGLRDS